MPREVLPIKSKVFQKLYGVDKNNKIKEWNIRVDNFNNYSTITYYYGQKDGKKVECKLNVSVGKNIGKKNETTHYTQAILDAQSKWNKKHDIDGYRTDITEILKLQDLEINKNYINESNINENTTKKVTTEKNIEFDIPLPMLAQDYKKHGKKLKYPCYIQPKLDGYRMIYNPITKKCTTRTGKEFTVIYDTQLYKNLCNLDIYTDGELYVHDTTFNFENYGVLRKVKGLTEKDKHNLNKIQYHIYDTINLNIPFKNRMDIIKKVDNLYNNIKVVNTYICNNQEDIDMYHNDFLKDNYEGSMLRNSDSKYICKYRSHDLLKYKNFDDGEFIIVDYTHENDTTGNDNKLIVWICKTSEGKRFNVQSKGTREERYSLYQKAEEYIGKELWVQYFGYTADGIPRFPKTMRNGIESIRNVIL